MNIFVTDPNWTKSAEALDDKRLVKMVLETAQIISTVAHKYGVQGEWYKPTHANHPCVVWAGECTPNFTWLILHGNALGAEYTKRFNKVHKSHDIISLAIKSDLAFCLPDKLQTPFANCTNYKHLPVIEAYRNHLADKWAADAKPPKWTSSNPPTWWTQTYSPTWWTKTEV